jgi:hypothetical protein
MPRFNVALVISIVVAALAALAMSTTADAKPVYGPGCVTRGWAPVNVPHSTIDGHAWAFCHRHKAPKITLTYMIMRYKDAKVDSNSGQPVAKVTKTYHNVKNTSKDVVISFKCKAGEWSFYELWANGQVFDPPLVAFNLYFRSKRVHLACPNPPKKSNQLLRDMVNPFRTSTASQGALSLAHYLRVLRTI